jgi:hypothetical protein
VGGAHPLWQRARAAGRAGLPAAARGGVSRRWLCAAF